MRNIFKVLIVIGYLLPVLTCIYVVATQIRIRDNTTEHVYTYKGFTSDDITLAMKFHGVTSVTITEFKCYFVNTKGDTINVFTDKCIEYLYKQKQKGMKK